MHIWWECVSNIQTSQLGVTHSFCFTLTLSSSNGSNGDRIVIQCCSNIVIVAEHEHCACSCWPAQTVSCWSAQRCSIMCVFTLFPIPSCITYSQLLSTELKSALWCDSDGINFVRRGALCAEEGCKQLSANYCAWGPFGKVLAYVYYSLC